MSAPLFGTTAFHAVTLYPSCEWIISTTGHAEVRKEGAMGLHELRECNSLTLQQLDTLTGADFTRLWVYENRDDEA